MSEIFKAYDIRGVVGDGLSEARAYLIGRGLASEVFRGEARPIVVSRDMRTHSPEMSAALVRGLCEGGCDVIDIGLAATPMNYWANVHYQSGGSVQVTASHNGPKYNGFKVSGAGATPLDFSTGLDKVEAFVLRAESGATLETAQSGNTRQIETALSEYFDFMTPFAAPGERKVKVAIDAGNGMAGFFLPELAARLPWLELVPLFWELDGTFPNHEADPLKAENLHDVEKATPEHGCDFGVAFDGDADRCMFVDERGVSISSDLITAFIAEAMLERFPQSAILYDLRSSHVVPESIAQCGGVPVRGRVGHSFMKRLMKEKDAPFGGELSGHYYFRECFKTDSGLMALLQILNIWRARSVSGQTMSQMIAPLRRYSATGEINYRVADAPLVLQRIEAYYGERSAELDHLDGLTVQMPNWWFNLRSSNTEPLLRLNLEAANDSDRDAKLQEVQTLIEGV